MTKKIIWRLKEQPTSKMLQELVSSGILNKNEAREILFNETEESERSIESLKQEIKFLRELIEKLANNQRVVEVIKEIRHTYDYPWCRPYYTWTDYQLGCSSDTLSGVTVSDASDTTYTSISANFSDISTF